MDHLFWRARKTHDFTDNKNLLYVFAPLNLCLNSPRHVSSKVRRWAIHLLRFKFFLNHVEKSTNIFEDILTKGSKEFRTTTAQTRITASLWDHIIPSSKEITLISMEEVKQEQERHSQVYQTVKHDEGCLRNEKHI